jgi:hypothetical protein
MTDRLLLFATGAITVSLFAYGFDFGGQYWQQFALIGSGFLLGNLITVADYAGDNP